MSLKITPQLRKLSDNAIREDLGNEGDVTSLLLETGPDQAEAQLLCKQDGVVAGLEIAGLVFKSVDPHARLDYLAKDGQEVTTGSVIMIVTGPVANLLTAERTALNFLQHLSGIATLTRLYVNAIKGTKARILDTRKTTPCLRELEKYAVRMGGGENHRMGLYDMVLIKENHIQAAGGITPAVSRIKKNMGDRRLDLPIEVETQTLDDVKEALHLNVNRIMLDNMPVEQIRQAVRLVDGRVPLEASGGVSLDTVREIAETGVDYISVGALTHSAPAFDVSLLLK